VDFYSSVHNDPLLFIDPNGLRRCHPLLGALAGGLPGGLGGGGVGGGLGAIAGAAIGTRVVLLLYRVSEQSRVAEGAL
jgi:hypothetical protein